MRQSGPYTSAGGRGEVPSPPPSSASPGVAQLPLTKYDYRATGAHDGYDCPPVPCLDATASLSSEDTYLLLKVAHKYGMHVLLSASYYAAAVNSIEDILTPAEQTELPAECLHTILMGQHQLNDLARTEVFEPLLGTRRDISVGCRRPIDCHDIRHQIIEAGISYLGANICPPLELLDGRFRTCAHLAETLCSKVWDILPSVFGLSDWDALQKARDELLGDLP